MRSGGGLLKISQSFMKIGAKMHFHTQTQHCRDDASSLESVHSKESFIKEKIILIIINWIITDFTLNSNAAPHKLLEEE